MKKIILGVFISTMTLVGCGGQQTSSNELTATSTESSTTQSLSCVSVEEYQQASPITQRLIDQIDAALAALESLNRNSNESIKAALVNVSIDNDGLLPNSIIIGKMGASDKVDMTDSCKICEGKSAYECISKAIEGKNNLDIMVSKKDGCIEFNW